MKAKAKVLQYTCFFFKDTAVTFLRADLQKAKIRPTYVCYKLTFYIHK